MKKIYQDLFHEFNFLNNLVYTKDGKILFTKTKQNPALNTYVSHIFLLQDGKIRQLTNGKNENYFIMEDDDTILFRANRTEDTTTHTEFYRLSLKDGGEAQLAFSLPLAVGSLKDIGDYYLVSAMTDVNCPDYHLLTKEEQMKVEAERKANEDYQVVDEYPYFYNGAGFINKTRNSLYLVDKKTLFVKRIFTVTMDVESFDYKDGEVLFTGIDFTDVKDKWSQVYKYNIAEDKVETLYGKHDMLVHGAKFYKSQILVMGTYGVEYGVTESSKFFTLKDGVMTFFTGNDNSFYNSIGSDSKWGGGKGLSIVDDELYFVPTFKSNAPLMKLVGTEYQAITDFAGCINDYAMVDDDIVAIAMVGQKLQEIYRINKDGSLTQLTTINEELMKDYYVATPEKVVVKKEACEVEGWVLRPYGFEEGKQYPAILDIHGGPRTAYGEVYYHEMQYWANEGYFVFFCNPRGSDGYGNEFADIRKEKYGTIDFEDIMDFTDEVIRRYPIDEKRVAVTGGSYGGFMTNWIIGHTDRFCCAASQRSISNWMSMMLASDYGIDVPFEHGFDNIYDCTKEIWRVSPLAYADKVVTPTLFIHSFEDYRCPYPEGMQLFTAIRCRGVDARMCLFKGENHELSRSGKPLHRSRRLKEITEWIKKYTQE